MNEEKIKEVFSDEEFVKSLLALETPEEVQAALAEKDIELSIDEIKQTANLLKKKTDGTLTDAELNEVAGGLGVITGAIIIGISAAIFGTTVGAVAYEGYHGRW